MDTVGETEGILEIEKWFPHLKESGYRATSPATPDYNCIAWATGAQDRWWEAEAVPGYYWPDSMPRDGTVNSIIALFESLGFIPCESGDLESGFEKVAVYGDRESYTHAARQLQDGHWTSKLGRLGDIEHDSPEGLVGQEYGIIVGFLRRHIKAEKHE